MIPRTLVEYLVDHPQTTDSLLLFFAKLAAEVDLTAFTTLNSTHLAKAMGIRPMYAAEHLKTLSKIGVLERLGKTTWLLSDRRQVIGVFRWNPRFVLEDRTEEVRAAVARENDVRQ